MTTEASTQGDSYMLEQWWHRLLRVLMYASTCVVLVIAGSHLVDISSNYTYSYFYSFEPNYEQAEGEEHTCSYDGSADSIYCGNINTLGDLTKKMEERSDTALSKSIKGKSDSASKKSVFEEEFDAWLAVRATIVKDLKSDKVRYRRATHWNAGPLVQSVGLTLGIATLWYVFTFMIYRIILFVVYGHTRVRKAPL